MTARRAEVLIYTLALPLVVTSLLVGPPGSIRATDVLAWVRQWLGQGTTLDEGTYQMVSAVLWHVRLPRILLALLTGGALTASGLALQALVRNPLVAPEVLGLSSGAAFGAALALATGWIAVQPSAFLFGLLAAALSYLLAWNRRGLSMVALVLAGMITGALFTAMLTLVQISHDPFKLQTIVYWTMGNLHNASWSKVRSAALPVLASCLVLYLLRWRMNVLALGDEEARASGLNPEREKLLVLLPAALASSASVAVAGIIGMVGLAVPHMVRMLVGPDNRRALPASLVFGGVFLVLVDDLARATTSFEIPIGVFTTLIGGPFFVWLLRRMGSRFGDA
jgi:iron complex transport system permease protein